MWKLRYSIENLLWRIDSYMMILKCDLKFLKEEGLFGSLYDEYELVSDKDGHEHLQLK